MTLRIGSMIVMTWALALVLAGCGGSDTAAPATPDTPAEAPSANATQPVQGDWIVVHLQAEPPHLNTMLASGGAYVVRVSGNTIFESLVMRDNETLEWTPWIAKSWEISDDQLTYTFHLRDDVTFSDGEGLTANDVKFTYDAIMNPVNDTADLRGYYVNVETCEVVDDYTVRFTCNKPYFLHFNFLGGIAVFPEHVYGQGDFNTGAFNRNPVGTGPYVLDHWDTGQEITLRLRDDYWKEEKNPHASKLVFKVITDDNAAFQVLQRGDMDYMRIASPEIWLRRTNSERFTSQFDKYELWSPVDGYYGSYSWIGWNMRRPYFSDARVRQAMTMLLDRETVLAQIFHGLGRVVTGHFFPASDAYDNSIAPYPFDPEQAKVLLTEAGWVDSNADGIRDKDGVDFRYEWLYPTGVSEYERMATVYKEELGKAGIDVTLRPLEWATYIESVHKRNFDACMMSWVSPVESDPYQIWHSSQIDAGSNYVGFNNARADEIIEEGRVTFDDDARNTLYREFHQILHEEQPYTFLYNRQRTCAVHKRFKNVVEYPLGFDIHEWWVPTAQQKYE